MTVPLAEKIAAVKSAIEIFEDEKASCGVVGVTFLGDDDMNGLRSVLADLEAQLAMLAVIEAARRVVDAPSGPYVHVVNLEGYRALQSALAALPSPPQEGA